jgi:hypothetical protein
MALISLRKLFEAREEEQEGHTILGLKRKSVSTSGVRAEQREGYEIGKYVHTWKVSCLSDKRRRQKGDKYANTWKVIKYLMYGRLGRAF